MGRWGTEVPVIILPLMICVTQRNTRDLSVVQTLSLRESENICCPEINYHGALKCCKCFTSLRFHYYFVSHI